MSKTNRVDRKSQQRRTSSLAEVWADISYAQRRNAELMWPWARVNRHNTHQH